MREKGTRERLHIGELTMKVALSSKKRTIIIGLAYRDIFAFGILAKITTRRVVLFSPFGGFLMEAYRYV